MAAHPSAMGQRLKVLVATDAARGSVRIMVHGCVTCVNLEGLDLVVRRASASTPDGRVVLDLGAAQAWWSVRADLDPLALAVRLTTTSSASTPLQLRVIAPRYIRS